MVAVFREVRRALKDEGTCWVNMGDSYLSQQGKGFPGTGQINLPESSRNTKTKRPHWLKPKDLCMMPARLAIALQADGWYLRSDIIWHKPNPMPESCTDRPTKSHEHIFLLTKKSKYWYDADAIREEAAYAGQMRGGSTNRYEQNNAGMDCKIYNTRNKRDVWTVQTCAYPDAHFATFPPKLIEPCILAGCPEWVCKKCGKARVRIVEVDKIHHRKPGYKSNSPSAIAKQSHVYTDMYTTQTKTTGWTDCGCGAGFGGGIVFDPFMGSGTVAEVAYNNNRHYVGIELSAEYVKLINKRMAKVKGKFALLEG